MKKSCFAAACLLLALICFSPLALILCSILGLHFDLTRPIVLSSAIALTAIVALLVSIDRGEVDKVSSVLLVLAAPLSMIGAISVLLSEHCSLWDLLLSAAVLVCLFLGFRFGSPKWLKIVVMTISMLFFIPLL